ncbi:mannose-6-phosphate isomerase-like protein (cupin superfamily) [Croceifilum oryzae]|uniref:Mannose-6-phosphate isomerase-like protein (Cupin superfamily) n=1 Tax=Croceifilum oryzae TaxID=1553429 RepID=A0AAJ1TEE2_9BACL|nr:cupin domain-containing protein [Croceifilum oryzae]MDQ0416939.1 mannose-6-phosphate isomerase-like protein (cupin superfamily) [Croceifilum oryzae]
MVQNILRGIKRSAAAIHFYQNLAKAAPDQKQQNKILQAAKKERELWREFTQLYIDLTGRHPVYEAKRISFLTYQGGVKRAVEIAMKDYEEYRNSYASTLYLPCQELFLKACQNEADQANLFHALSLIKERVMDLKDYGKRPFVINIDNATEKNENFRTVLWTGNHLQVVLMSIDVGDDIGLEVHPDVDQFLRIEDGEALVQMGNRKDKLDFEIEAYEDYAIMVPAGTWHNITNTGNKSLKLYSIYAPPEHPFGTVEKQKTSHQSSDNEN